MRPGPRSRLLSSTIVLLCALGGASLASAQDFYTERLEAGKTEFREARFTDASDDFRIASFGFLDKPALLSESLVRLALAQSGAKLTDDARATINRFLEIERRFPFYVRANLEPETRAQFQEVLTRLVPEAAIRSVPTLANLVDSPEQKILKLPAKEREGALKAMAAQEPKEPRWPLHLARLAAANSDDREAIRWATLALELSPADPDALALRGHALVSRSDYPKALADLSALPPARLDREPALAADLFVCEVAVKDWDAAQALEPRLDAALDRKDVRKARDQLARQMDRTQKEAQKAAQEAQKAAQKEAPKDPPTAPKEPEKEAERKSAAEVPPPVATPARPTAPPAAEPAGSGPVDAVLLESRQLVAAGKAAEAEEKLLPLASANPKRRDVRLALLEVACLARDWRTGVAQVIAVSPFRDGEEPSMFYAAVVMFESGDPGRAKSYLQRALPRIASTPYTQFYAKKIGGP